MLIFNIRQECAQGAGGRVRGAPAEVAGRVSIRHHFGCDLDGLDAKVAVSDDQRPAAAVGHLQRINGRTGGGAARNKIFVQNTFNRASVDAGDFCISPYVIAREAGPKVPTIRGAYISRRRAVEARTRGQQRQISG